MFYVDSQHTLTRRDSSLVVPRGPSSPSDFTQDIDNYPHTSVGRLNYPDPAAPVSARPYGSVRKEVVTSMFEVMIQYVVDSWEKIERTTTIIHSPRPASSRTEITKKKKDHSAKVSKSQKTTVKKSASKPSMDDVMLDPMLPVLWSAPDERAIIRFTNGNVYEGNISMKCLDGDGRFQWADGTVYIGDFQNNEMKGRGKLFWKDDSWYEGEFSKNLRHGQGLFVDSRRQRSYSGGWHLGAKHGEGTMYYSGYFSISYSGDWENNVRHGHGLREYGPWSCYQGEWEHSVKHGKGVMIWPNHDFYAGDWINGKMSGYGTYLWDVALNETMTLRAAMGYYGEWLKGTRNGFGTLELGLGLGSFYQGQFADNKKHGHGQLVTNNGLVLEDSQLFIHDLIKIPNYGPESRNSRRQSLTTKRILGGSDAFHFKYCDDSVGIDYHIREALKIVGRDDKIREHILKQFFESNKDNYELRLKPSSSKKENTDMELDLEDLIDFEKSSLLKAVKCHETLLKDIYFKYANTCTKEAVNFNPVLLRLYLWQFYYDCDVQEKGLSLVDIDVMLYKNSDFLLMSPHHPFEPIQYWQFLHSMIMVSSKLFVQTHFPGPKPDTILAAAFRTFMDDVASKALGRFKGHLSQEFTSSIPLNGMYKLYQSIGEPHSLRMFLCAVRRPSHLPDLGPRPELVEAPEASLLCGRNVYVIGNEMIFRTKKTHSFEYDNIGIKDSRSDYPKELEEEGLYLYNFGNLTSAVIIKILAELFPNVCGGDKVLNLEYKISFLEFIDAFMDCATHSVTTYESVPTVKGKKRHSRNAHKK